MISALGLLFVLAASPAGSPAREVTKVEVVEVPVYVTRSGEPVDGLKAENFELSVNGKPQKIDYFDTIDFSEVSAGTRETRQRRLYFLLFDLASDRTALTRARRAMDEFVANAGDSDVFAVGTIFYGRLRILVPFTPDRESIRHAIRHIDAKAVDPLRISIDEPFVSTEAEPSGDDRYGADFADAVAFSEVQQDLLLDPLRDALVKMFSVLEQLTKDLSELQGNKHLVLLSTGFDSSVMFGGQPDQPFSSLRRQPSRLDQLQTRSMTGSEPGMNLPDYYGTFGKALDALAARAANGSVFLDAIDIAGIRMTIGGREKDSLYLFARNGQVIGNRNNLGDAMEHLTETQRTMYILGFHAHDTGRNENRIHLRLRGVGGRPSVQYRRSYSSTVAAPPSTDALFLADVLNNDIPQNGITVTAAVTVERGTATLAVEIPGREFLAFGDRIMADAMLYVFSGKRAVAFRHKQITIDSQRARALESEAIHLREAFDLPPGNYAAKVLLRINGTDARGFTRSDFVVAQ